MANKETRSTTPPVTVPSPENSTDNGVGCGGSSNSNSSNNGNGVKVIKSQRKRDKKVSKDKDKGDKNDGNLVDKMSDGGNNREDDNTWDCTVCTYKNPAEAFKCLMCDVRKGTSTRKPRINPELVAQQVARQQQHLLQKISHGRTKDGTSSGRESRESNRDGNSRDGHKDGGGGIDHKEKVKDTIREGNGKESSSSRVDNDSGPETKKHSSSHKQTKHRKSINSDDTSHATSNHSHNRSINNNNNIHTKSSSSGINNFSSEAVTVNNVTVIITEFSKDLKDRSSLSSLPFSQLN